MLNDSYPRASTGRLERHISTHTIASLTLLATLFSVVLFVVSCNAQGEASRQAQLTASGQLQALATSNSQSSAALEQAAAAQRQAATAQAQASAGQDRIDALASAILGLQATALTPQPIASSKLTFAHPGDEAAPFCITGTNTVWHMNFGVVIVLSNEGHEAASTLSIEPELQADTQPLGVTLTLASDRSIYRSWRLMHVPAGFDPTDQNITFEPLPAKLEPGDRVNLLGLVNETWRFDSPASARSYTYPGPNSSVGLVVSWTGGSQPSHLAIPLYTPPASALSEQEFGAC